MGNFASLKRFAVFSLTGDSPGVPVPEDAAEAGAAAKVASHTHGPVGIRFLKFSVDTLGN